MIPLRMMFRCFVFGRPSPREKAAFVIGYVASAGISTALILAARFL